MNAPTNLARFSLDDKYTVERAAYFSPEPRRSSGC
jgi:hypothetical protein